MRAVVIVSCRFEWQATLRLFPDAVVASSPLGDWFTSALAVDGRDTSVVFFQGGWGKISAAASAQYVIDRWAPAILVNLGTCGGFAGEIERGEILLVERAVVYDIVEQMTDPEAAIAHYATDLDLAWLGGELPQPVRRSLIVSADRDLIADEIPRLKARFGAVAGDWESGSIAWVAARNGVRCLILRGVSDLVGPGGGEAYQGNLGVYVDGAAAVMKNLIQHLPAWLSVASRGR
ncbi:MAG: 5'-methylthioadenosine/S-adenosylhomocysteine nucleosidase [Acidobacteriota bacterium]